MKGQYGLIIGLIIALLIAVFAVINVDPVEVNYLFGTADWPLVLIILGSVLMGGLLVGFVGMVKVYRLQQENKQLKQASGTGSHSKNEKNARENSRRTGGADGTANAGRSSRK
ncbi:lipopolysaccharide assembly LapA domain-containing protein [Thalassorhabdus alkalitolerans]|uniref:Lipopolysaccharide assembly LapA domain-containing protein n=1 Tax=Thalassorhabdus alkalitolerans TaxID=2282697 RepID=A0ABW0YM22_9BACI